MDTHCLVIGQRYVLSQTALYSSQWVQNMHILGYATYVAIAIIRIRHFSDFIIFSGAIMIIAIARNEQFL